MNPSYPHRCSTLGGLLTNAKKVTVSVLYWYEKLSSPRTEIFELILKRINKINLFYLFNYPRGGVMGTPPGQVTPTPHGLHPRVRPYLVESTTSRPICEVKQLQA